MTRLSLILLIAMMALADIPKDVPHLAYSPNGAIQLVLPRKLPPRFRICAQGEKFRWCTDWVKPKTREAEIETTVPKDTPDGEYHLIYEDDKGTVDLKNHFTVGK
jgi:hypothetical protein